MAFEHPRPPADHARIVAEAARRLLAGGDEGRRAALEGLGEAVPFAWAALALGGADALALREVFERGASGGLVKALPPPLTQSPRPPGGAAVSGALRDLLSSRGHPSVLEAALEGEAGVLVLARSRPFDEGEAALASAVGGLLAAGLRRADRERALEARMEERTAELSGVYEACRGLGYALDIGEVERLVLDAVDRLIAPAASALLLDVLGHRRVGIRLGRPLREERVAALREGLEVEYRARGGRDGASFEVRAQRAAGFAASAAPLGGRPARGLTAPLTRRGLLVGLLRVDSGAEGDPPADRTRPLYTVLSQAEMSLDRILTLREREESRLGHLLDSLPLGVLLADGELEVLVANPAARRLLLRFSGSDVPPRLADVADPDLAVLARRVLHERQDRASAEFTLARTGGILAVTVAPVRSRAGEAEGVVVVMDDVTEARRLQEQLSQTEKLSALGEMIAGVAHELNNPLATVLGFAQLLRRADLPEEAGRRARILEDEAQRCQRIVANLLSFARKHKPGKALVDLGAVVDSVLQLVRYQLRVSNVDVELLLDPALPPVLGDQHALQQVFLNLITNAQHALAESKGRRRLRIAGRSDAGRVRLEVSDTGPGIAPENLGRIFDPFFTTKEPGHGTGLGLSLVYATLRDHDGEIRAESHEGEGTTFVLTLPPAPTPGPDAPAEGADGAGPAAARGKTILVVEDERNVAEVLEAVLREDGAVVEVVGDGAEAQRRLESGGVDLIISDLRMPRVDGRELYDRVLRDNPRLARRIVFASGDVISHETRTFFERTGNPVLSKPFDLQEVRRVVARALRDH